MKTKELSFAQQIALRWYEEDHTYFDTAGNNEWLLLYMNKWLGIQQYTEWFVQERMAKMPYETFRRAVQYLIQHDYIILSDEHKRKRHRSEVETRETILTTTPPKTRIYIFNEQNQTYKEQWV